MSCLRAAADTPDDTALLTLIHMELMLCEPEAPAMQWHTAVDNPSMVIAQPDLGALALRKCPAIRAPLALQLYRSTLRSTLNAEPIRTLIVPLYRRVCEAL